jgi:hypothetical protein
MITRRNLIIGTAALVIIGGALYWYEWRPTALRKYCNKEAAEAIKESDSNLGDRLALYEFAYLLCMRSRGLEGINE